MNSLTFKYGYLAMIVAVGAASTAFADETKTLRLDAGDLSSMRFETTSGSLDITGTDGNQIEVLAEIVSVSNDYQLTLEKSGTAAVLVGKVKPPKTLAAERQSINLSVKIPSRLQLDIADGSGELKLRNIRAAVKIDDGSGAIAVKNVTGEVTISDGAGDLNVSEIVGKLAIDDAAGAIVVANVNGDVDIRDGSGSIEVTTVDGQVMIRDGAGGIAVSRVTRGLKIRGGGSGQVRTSEIEGGITKER